MISSEDFLTLMLDTPLSNPQLATFLLSGVAVGADEPYRLDSILDARIKEIAEAHWGRLAPNKSKLLPVVCINCRNIIGFASDELVVDNCEGCEDPAIITDKARAYRRLVARLKYTSVKSISPIIEFIATKVD